MILLHDNATWREAVRSRYPGSTVITNKIDTTEHAVHNGYMVASWFTSGYGKIWTGLSKVVAEEKAAAKAKIEAIGIIPVFEAMGQGPWK